MTNDNDTHRQGEVLWRRLERVPDQGDALTGWDANLLAAYLEGELAGDEHAAFEARLAEEPVLLEALLAARDALDGQSPGNQSDVPPDFMHRLKDAPPAEVVPMPRLVAGAANDATRKGGRFRRPAEWAAVAAALIAVSAVGFELGSETGRNTAKVNTIVAETGGLDLDLDGQNNTRNLSLEEADEAFNGGEL